MLLQAVLPQDLDWAVKIGHGGVGQLSQELPLSAAFRHGMQGSCNLQKGAQPNLNAIPQ